MTKADIVTKISRTTQVDESLVSPIVESFMATVKDSLANNENVYLREFGSFVVKHRAQKVGRNIAQKTKVIIPAQDVPVFKPADSFKTRIITVTE